MTPPNNIVSYCRDAFRERPVFVVVIAGILLRLAIMPFFCHVDLFSEFRRVVYSLNNDIYFPQQNRLVTYFIESAFLSIFLPLLKNPELVFRLDDVTKTTSNLTDYFVFITDPYVFRHLFIFKLPYLVFDVLTMWVIWAFFDDKKRAYWAVLFWVFNPITLYASYFFGRYEAIAIFFVALTVLLLKKEKIVLAGLCLALAINAREIYVVLAPIFMIALYKRKLSWRHHAKIMMAGLVLVLCVALPILAEQVFQLQPAFAKGSVYQDSKAGALFSMSYQWFYPLVFTYALLLFMLFTRRDTNSDSTFILGSGLALVAYFALTNHSAHYVAWLPLFPILLMNYSSEPKQLGKAILVFFVAWFAYRVFKGDINLFTLFLAAPFSFDLTLFPSLPRVYSRAVGEGAGLFDTTHVLNVLHSVFAAALIFMAYHMTRVRRHVQPQSHPKSSG